MVVLGVGVLDCGLSLELGVWGVGLGFGIFGFGLWRVGFGTGDYGIAGVR